VTRKEEIEARLKELAEERSVLMAEHRDITTAEQKARFGFGPGDTIVDQGGKKFLIYSYDGSWAKGYKIRKDGTPSKSLQHIFNLSACEKVTPGDTQHA
jgi:hypothetical protein